MIELREVSKSYGAHRAVGPLNLAVGKSEFVALLGGSGCGKTTTLKMINALVAPDAGEVLIEGVAAGAEPPYRLRRRIGYVFQEVGLFPHLSVAENIAVGPRLAGWDRARIAARTAELLELVALPAATLPGGLPPRCRVGSASGSESPALWRRVRR